MSNKNNVLKLWENISKLPYGTKIFSKLVQYKAPYFKTMNVDIEELRPQYVRLRLKKRALVKNHIGTVHVIAICNLLEMAMGIAAEVSVPSTLRWIPKGMDVNYISKGDTDIIGVAEIEKEAWKPGDLNIKVTAMNTSGVVVVEGVIKLWVSKKKV